jgi:hypothetical protein
MGILIKMKLWAWRIGQGNRKKHRRSSVTLRSSDWQALTDHLFPFYGIGKYQSAVSSWLGSIMHVMRDDSQPAGHPSHCIRVRTTNKKPGLRYGIIWPQKPYNSIPCWSFWFPCWPRWLRQEAGSNREYLLPCAHTPKWEKKNKNFSSIGFQQKGISPSVTPHTPLDSFAFRGRANEPDGKKTAVLFPSRYLNKTFRNTPIENIWSTNFYSRVKMEPSLKREWRV